jgi:hypothetical protein
MKLALVVRNALNGDSDEVPSAVRRTVYAMANELDEQSEQWDDKLEAMSQKIDSVVTDLRSDVTSVRRLLIGLTSTVIAGIVVGIVNVLLTF